jgi:NYN domain
MSDGNRRVWLIDGAYMFMAQDSLGPGFKFGYKKLRDRIERDGRLVQGYYVNSTPSPPTDAQDAFHTWLKSGPPRGPKLQVRLYKLKELHLECPKCSTQFDRRVQKGVDIGIATLALTLVDRYDTLILSSGDGDFKDALEHIRNTLDKRLELVVFKAGVSTDLQSLSDHIYWIDDFKDVVAKT